MSSCWATSRTRASTRRSPPRRPRRGPVPGRTVGFPVSRCPVERQVRPARWWVRSWTAAGTGVRWCGGCQNQVRGQGDDCLEVGFSRRAHDLDVADPGLDVLRHLVTAPGHDGADRLHTHRDGGIQGSLVQGDHAFRGAGEGDLAKGGVQGAGGRAGQGRSQRQQQGGGTTPVSGGQAGKTRQHAFGVLANSQWKPGIAGRM